MKKQTEWRTHDGMTVPESAVSPYDKKKEPKIQSMYKKLRDAKAKLAEVEDFVMTTADELIRSYYAANGREWKNLESYTLYNYDKSIRVVSRKNSVLQLSDDVNLANAAFNDYLDEVLTDKSADIRVLITRAFSTSKGELDPKRLTSLLGLKIEHPLWKKACEILRSAISTNSTKRFIKVSVKDENGEYVDV